MSASPLVRILLILGLVLIAVAGLLYLVERLGFTWGNVPGDIRVERENFSCVLALGTSLLLSIVLTVVLNLVLRLLNR